MPLHLHDSTILVFSTASFIGSDRQENRTINEKIYLRFSNLQRCNKEGSIGPTNNSKVTSLLGPIYASGQTTGEIFSRELSEF